jgi:hypothetical protein
VTYESVNLSGYPVVPMYPRITTVALPTWAFKQDIWTQAHPRRMQDNEMEEMSRCGKTLGKFAHCSYYGVDYKKDKCSNDDDVVKP